MLRFLLRTTAAVKHPSAMSKRRKAFSYTNPFG
jgi:hypothetical protein